MEKKSNGISAILLLALIQGFLASGAVEVQPSINPAAVGQTVTLSLSASLRSGTWAVGESLILTWLGNQQAVFPSHSGRASVNVHTGDLTLSSVTVDDSGVYVVQSSDPQLKANASITVLEPISNVTLNVNQTELMEFNSSAELTCSVSSGSSFSYLWMNGSSEVSATGRLQLTDGGSTLTVVNVTRYDQGPFRCCVFNPVSNSSSDSVNFTISYGPDNMALTVNGQNTTSFSAGSNLTILCSSQSNPPAQLQWAFRGELVNVTGPLLELSHVGEDQSGPYSCLAFNNYTNMHDNITTHIIIAKSGSDQHAVNMLLLSLLLAGFLFSYISGRNKVWQDHVYSQSITASQNPVPVGSSVTLSSTVHVSTGTWIFNNNLIVFISPQIQAIANSWRDRVTYNSSTSSLTLRSLTLDDSGIYTLEDLNVFRAQLTLSVQVPISNVTLWAKETNLVEYNDTAVLMCSVSNGSSLSFEWLDGNSTVTAGGQVLLSNGNATLTILNVTHHYQGPFRCKVSNGISHEISAPVHLNISYGPSNTTMMITPMKDTYKTGSKITLSCSAESSPPAMIKWIVDGVYLNQSGPQLQLENVTQGNSGHYTCVLHNTVTSRFSSASAMIQVLDPITAVVVKPTSGPAMLHEPFTLQCEVAGSADTILWWMNGQPISADNATVFGMNNKTLTLNSVQPSDNGHYKCQAFNSVSNMTSSPYTVNVIYGPEMPTITGPTAVKTGDNVTFSCYASSNPPSHYKWYFNGSLVSNMSEYITPHLPKETVRKYICMAFNNVTGQNSSAYIMLTVVDPIENVQVEAPDNLATEGNSYNLTCNVTGPADHVYWMKNGELLHENNRTVFSMDNKTVSFIPLNHYDTGDYQCMAVNAVGNMTSPLHMLLVNFGPETPIIQGPDFAETGGYAVFNCSAMSVPPSHFSWWYNGSMVANTSVFKAGPLSLNMTGEYTCMAYNNVTGKNSTNSAMLTVIEAIESVMVQNSTTPINNENFTLTCDVGGPYDTIYWMKDNMKLNMTNPHSSYHIEKNMLHFTPVTTYNDGSYQCVATNQAAQHESVPYILLVNYGPLSVTISGPDSAELGTSGMSLTCSADSRPECHFYWFLNNQSNPLTNGPVITFSVTKESEGTYICKARNPVTNITMYQSKTFAVSGHASAIHFSSHSSLMLMALFAFSTSVLFN
ncbi:carcinoembryonic antigen-related cell adhesion molecule 1 [Amphiprion ocellaris]|uniref:carcinoembryonic antigen-related cell adhesion molecule 1 n=1 Tax=Amphiprion ocellaris TaxID=80972 RepID=UPI002410DA70|nr:carcinoembryonic antigen-related cell adhesion molecule 1 [Amphiprion ocellaris]